MSNKKIKVDRRAFFTSAGSALTAGALSKNNIAPGQDFEPAKELPMSCEEIKSCVFPDLANQNNDNLGDALIGFRQPVAAAVGRTLHEKLAEWVMVKDFGAVGDGATDDSVALNAAIDATAVSNSAVYFPVGVYCLNTSINITVPIVFAPGASIKPTTGTTITIQQAILAAPDPVIFDMTAGGNFNLTWTSELIANWWSGDDIGEQVNNLFASIDLSKPRKLGRTAKVRIIGDHELLTPINMTNLRPIGNLVVTMNGRLLCKVGTDKPAIDMVGSRNILAINWTLYGDVDDKPGIGILCARTTNPRPEKRPESAGSHRFMNVGIYGAWTISPVYMLDAENTRFQNPIINTKDSRYGFFFGGTNIDSVSSPHLPIDASKSQTDLHVDGLYMRVTNVEKGGFYVSGADRIHLGGLTYINSNSCPKLVLDMNIAGINGFWCDSLHCEGKSVDGIQVNGVNHRLANVFIRTLGLGATKNAIIFDGLQPDGRLHSINVRNARFEFTDATRFFCTKKVNMEHNVEIITNGGDDAPEIILGRDFNGEIWGGDITKLILPSRIMAGHYHDGKNKVVHEFKFWPVLTFPDGEERPNVGGSHLFKTANSSPTTIKSFAGGQTGQEITILMDGNTTIRRKKNIQLRDPVYLGKEGDMITFIKMDSRFIEKSRSSG